MTLPITQVALTPYDELLAPKGGRRMDLPGFDAEFVDFPDYIIRVTDRIWHDRDVELCKRYYTDDCPVHTLAGDVFGADVVTANTYKMMEAFPDRRLEPDNVIWSYEGDGRFYSSHLITSLMTNTGPSEFGPATGKQVKVRTIADCLCWENRIGLEWLMRDTGGMVAQMGLDVDAVAQSQAQADAKTGLRLTEHHSALHASVMTFGETISAGDPLWLHGVLTGHADVPAAPYFDRVSADYPMNRQWYGKQQIAADMASLRTAIPDAKVRVDHVASTAYLDGGRDWALRFTLAGTHLGDGRYGPASGAPVVIMAACHWRIIHGAIHREWMVFDELAVRRQIWTHRLAP